MGVDCVIRLPANIRVADVAEILGIAAGLEKVWQSNQHYEAVEVKGASVSSCLPNLVQINLDGDMVDGEKHHFVHYHFEGKGGTRVLMPRSTAFWIACGVRLVDFYGGTIDFNDCDDVYEDYKVRHRSNDKNCPEDGKAWSNFQKRIMAVESITKEELQKYDQFAAYKINE